MTDPVTDALLDQPLYSYSEVDRLAGLHSGTARRWINGYERNGRIYDPVLRPQQTEATTVTWGEFVETRLLAEYRASGVPLARLRPAIEILRAEIGPYPLARQSTWLTVENRELVWDAQRTSGVEGDLRLVLRSGQVLTNSFRVRRFMDVTEFDDSSHVATRIRLLGPESSLVVDPTKSFGAPSIRNVRADVIAEEIAAGASINEVAGLWDLTHDDVHAALSYAA